MSGARAPGRRLSSFGRGVHVPPPAFPVVGTGAWARPLLADGDCEGFWEAKAQSWAPEGERGSAGGAGVEGAGVRDSAAPILCGEGAGFSLSPGRYRPVLLKTQEELHDVGKLP